MTAAVEAREFVDQFNADYETRHRAFEEQFWGTKMNLQDARYSAEELTRTKTEMESLLQDKAVLEKAQQLRSQFTDDDRLIKTLDIIIRTCQCYQMNDEAAAIRRETSQLESSLEMARNAMKLGYSLDDETFVEASSVKLRNLLRTADGESVRRAAYEGLRSIGPFVLSHGFVDIIKLRNRLAKSLGFVDYYGTCDLCDRSKAEVDIRAHNIMTLFSKRLQGNECRGFWQRSSLCNLGCSGTRYQVYFGTSTQGFSGEIRTRRRRTVEYELQNGRQCRSQDGSLFPVCRECGTLRQILCGSRYFVQRSDHKFRSLGSAAEIQQRILSLASASVAKE